MNLQDHSEVFIRQKKEWIEIVVDFETKNQYEIVSSSGQALGWILERAGGFMTTIGRFILRSHRPLEIDVFDEAKQALFHLSRSFFFLFSDLFVTGTQNQKFGAVHRRFGIIYKKYDLIDDTGQIFARIKSPIWRLWTFPVLDHMGEQRAVITKRWQGLVKEAFTDADAFCVSFGTHPWTESQRKVLFAAAISIDFDFFENQQGAGSVVDTIGG